MAPPILICPGCRIDLLGNEETKPKQPLVSGFRYQFEVTCSCGMMSVWLVDWRGNTANVSVLASQQASPGWATSRILDFP